MRRIVSWPNTLVAFRRTDDLTLKSAPEELLRGKLGPGEWALVRVRGGTLTLVDLLEGREGELNPQVPGFLEPESTFELHGPPETVFYVEYYRDASQP